MAALSVKSLPLGFRFQPTDVELVNHYLKGKIRGRLGSGIEIIPEINVCKCEPWDIPDKSLIKSSDPEWFFFSPKDRKYSNGNRFNRATGAGYWKPTGKDRVIKSQSSRSSPIGLKKTLVFYRGRAPNGIRTNWVMHEYRIAEPEFESVEQGGYVLLRLFNKSEEKKTTFDVDDCSETLICKLESEASPPTSTGSLAGEIQHGLGAILVDKTVAPMNQEFQYSHLEEVSQSCSLTNNIQSLGTEMFLEQNRDNDRNFPMEAQNYCLGIMAPEDVNYEANLALAKLIHYTQKEKCPTLIILTLFFPHWNLMRIMIFLMDLIKDFNQSDSNVILSGTRSLSSWIQYLLIQKNTPLRYQMSKQIYMRPCSQVRAPVIPCQAGRLMCHNVEDAIWQERVGFSAEVDEPPIFASCFSYLKVDVPHMNRSRAHLSIDSSSGVLHHKPTFMSESRGMGCINDINMEKQATQADLDSGIKLRTQQFSCNQDGLMEPQNSAEKVKIANCYQ